MDKHTISFRLDSDKLNALDALAESLERDRTYLLNEAVENYLEVRQWQVEEIKAGLKEAAAGKLTRHEDIKASAAKWRRR